MAGNAAVSALVEHHATLYQDLADPVALLRAAKVEGERGTALNAFWPYAGSDAPAALHTDEVAAIAKAAQE